MLDENLIATLEQSLRQTRNAQTRLIARLREVEEEADRLHHEIEALENSAQQTAQAIESLLTTVRPSGQGKRSLGSGSNESGYESQYDSSRVSQRPLPPPRRRTPPPVPYIGERTGAATSGSNPSNTRFSDKTITQACTLILREYGTALHVNELYQILLDGGMEFTGNNPTISIAVSLNRNRRFCKVAPGTFDLVLKDASSQAAS